MSKQRTIVGTATVAACGMETFSCAEGMLCAAQQHIVGVTTTENAGATANRMYVNFAMPSTAANHRIRKVELVVFQHAAVNETSIQPMLGIYRAEEVAAANQAEGAFASTLTDYEPMVVSSESEDTMSYAFDITSLIDVETTAVTATQTLVMKLLNEDLACNCNAELYGASDSNHAPILRITYAINYGVDASTRAHKLGRFGRGSVDLATGNLALEFEDFSWGGSRMPMTLKHQYTSALAGYRYTSEGALGLLVANYSFMKLGLGWRLNVMQSMVSATFTLDDTQYSGYLYTNENGDEMYLVLNNDEVYEDITGSGAVFDPTTRKMTQGDAVYQFDSMGRLVDIADQSGNSMTIRYAGSQIVAVIDGAGRIFRFSYEDGNLIRITAPDQTAIQYVYSGPMLQKIIYPDGRYAEITMGTNGVPRRIMCYGSEGIEMQGVTYEYRNGKVYTVAEIGTSNEGNSSRRLSSYIHTVASSKTTIETIEYTDADDGTTIANDVVTVYAMDRDGKIVSEYVRTTDTARNGANNLFAVGYVSNLLGNGNFNDNSCWGAVPAVGSAVIWSRKDDEANTTYSGNVLEMTSENESNVESGVCQEVAAAAGQYTLSAYLRAGTNITGSDNSGVYLRVVDENGDVLAESDRIDNISDAYERVIVHFEVISTQNISIQILMDGMGTAYGGAVQLEANSSASAYNLLSGGGFSTQTTGQTYSANAALNTENSFADAGNLEIVGNPEFQEYACQNVAVFADAGTRETFTLSGWAKGSALPVRNRGEAFEPTFRLRAVIHYSDNTSETYTADFASHCDDWQQAIVQFAKKAYKTVSGMVVYCDYDYNTGTAYFDNIQLVRDSLETGLTEADFTEETADDTITEEENTFEEAKDAYGNTLTETIFDADNLDCGTIYRSFVYGNSGNDLTQETDPRGNVTSYDVDATTSRITTVTDRCGNKTGYEYDACGRTTKVTAKDADGVALSNVSYSYDSLDNLAEITRGDGMGYGMQYDAFHELESIGITGKDEKLVTYGYNSGHGRLKTVTYANGDTMKVAYNSLGQLVSEKWYDAVNVLTASYRYVYDSQGTVIRSIDILNLKEYNYSYDEGRLLRAVECTITLDEYENVISKTTVNEIRYSYDTDGNMTGRRLVLEGGRELPVRQEVSDSENRTVYFAGTSEIVSHSQTDALGRKAVDGIRFNSLDLYRQFSYHAGQITQAHIDNEKQQSGATTRLVNLITLYGGRTIAYEYDGEERITKVTDSRNGITEYTYDALGQLLTETVNGTVVNTMTYDNYGNILAKNGKTYTYGNAVWKDLLVAYDGQGIFYDAQGNPVSYLGHTLTWEKGRQLKSFDNITYTYNANGIRTSKRVQGIKHTYALDGSKILQETWANNNIVPLYDTEDAVCGMIYNGTPYFFQKNLQGDVIGITNVSGTIVARYSYDAWGACTILSDNTNGIATVNPFRYRGYYFDTETNLYYLQSRYYDPQTGRFINADHVQFATYLAECVLEHNLYAYTSNSTLVHSDHSGCAPGAATVTYAIAQQMGILAAAGATLLTAVKALIVSIYNVFIVVGLVLVVLAAVVAICKVVNSIYEQIENAVKASARKYEEYKGKVCVYVLAWNANNAKSIFYVGRTKNVISRFAHHKKTKGNCYFYVVYVCKDIIQSRVVEQGVLGACLAENFTSIAFGKKPSNAIRGIASSKVNVVIEMLKDADELYETLSLLGCTSESDLLLLLGQ